MQLDGRHPSWQCPHGTKSQVSHARGWLVGCALSVLLGSVLMEGDADGGALGPLLASALGDVDASPVGSAVGVLLGSVDGALLGWPDGERLSIDIG